MYIWLFADLFKQQADVFNIEFLSSTL